MPSPVTEAVVLATLLLHPIHTKLTDNHLFCMSANVYHEARGTSIKARLGVAHVTAKRVRIQRKVIGNSTVCKIVKAPAQFSWTRQRAKINKSKFEEDLWNDIVIMSANVMNGKTKDPTNGATHFCERKARGKIPWCRNARVTAVIDNIIFVIPREKKQPSKKRRT